MLIRRQLPAAPAQAEMQLLQVPKPVAVPVNRAAAVLHRAASRVAKPVSVDSSADKQKLEERVRANVDEQLKLLSIAEAEIDAAVAKQNQCYKVIEAQLRLANLTEHVGVHYTAAIEEQWTNQTRNIDPKIYRANVEADVFWATIKVPIGAAEKVLAEKELTRITVVTPGKLTGYALKVKRHKVQMRKTK